MVDASVEAFGACFEVHGPTECEDVACGGEAGAEVYYGGGGESTSCAVGEDQCWRLGRCGVMGGILMAFDGLRDEV